MLHRDLKPSNVLVTPDGRVVILDFGLITEVQAKPEIAAQESKPAAGAPSSAMGRPSAVPETDQGHIVGTVSYMAPEQAAVMPLTPAADWYSFGVMMYQALVGELPFSGTAKEILEMKRTSQVIPPNRRRRGIPGDLSSLCARLLQNDATMRPKYSEIKASLTQSSASRPVPSQLERSPSSDPPFVGRDRELSYLRGAYQHVLDGTSCIVLVRGRSGSGKTCLLKRFLDRELHKADAAVLTGRCFEQESVPFKAVDSLVDSLSRYLMSLPSELVVGLQPRDAGPLTLMFPVLRRVDSIAATADTQVLPPDPIELRRRAFGALRQLLFQLGQIRPIVLWIDDLQWGDLDSAELLTELLRGPVLPRLLLLASFRSEDEDVNPCLKAISQPEQFLRGGAAGRATRCGPIGID